MIKTIEEKIELMKAYLLQRYYEDDFHGVMDAACDIRELLREQKVRQEIKDNSKQV